jgi:hypothetical protein
LLGQQEGVSGSVEFDSVESTKGITLEKKEGGLGRN